MTSTSALVDTVALILFQNLREGMETGRIADMNAAHTEVEAAIAELNSRRTLEEPTTRINSLVGKLLLEVGSLHEKVAKCESHLAEVQCQAKAVKEDTTQIVARTETCNLLAEQQQKESAKILAAVDRVKASMSTASPPCVAPVPPPADSSLRSSPSRVAIISFPGGPRTVTIHPPDSPSYQSSVVDEKGDIIINFRHTKPLRREGAFRGPLEDVDWVGLTRVCGRGPELPGDRAVPPVPNWPDRSQPSSHPPSSRGPSDIIARQRQLSQTDPFGRIIAPEYPNNTKSSSLSTSTSTSSSLASSRDPQSSLSAKPEILSTPSSTPPSRSLPRGKKRTRDSEDDKGMPLTTETCEEISVSKGRRPVKEPTTPTPINREDSCPPEGPSKRKKLRPSTSGSLSRKRSLLDLSRAA